MKINERQAEILNRIVQEYISLAQPISSQLLERKYNLGVCSATIRIDMQKLTAKGLLYQPHSSAGRIPTDRGYRFFVNRIFEKEINFFEEDFEAFELENCFEKEIDDIIRFIQSITKKLAMSSSALVLSYLEREKIFWKEGWEEVLKEPEFEEKKYLFNFTDFLKNFEENIEILKGNSGIKVYIGKENPFKKAKDFSIISFKCCLPDNEETIISILGPKRMAYDRNISLMNSLLKLFENIRS